MLLQLDKLKAIYCLWRHLYKAKQLFLQSWRKYVKSVLCSSHHFTEKILRYKNFHKRFQKIFISLPLKYPIVLPHFFINRRKICSNNMILNIIMQYLCSFGNVYIVTDRGNARWMALCWYHHIYHTLVELLCYLWSSLWSVCRNHILSKTICICIGTRPAKQVVIHSNNS